MKKLITLFVMTSSIMINAQDVSSPLDNDLQASLHTIDSTLVNINAQKILLAGQMAKAEIRYFIIHVPDEKYGYTIFIDGYMYIQQQSIPGLEGTKGFAIMADAEKLAKQVVEKIKQGELPPSVTRDELMALGIED